MKVIHAKIVSKTKKMFLFRCEKIFYLSILFKKIFCFEISHTKFLAVLEDLKESRRREAIPEKFKTAVTKFAVDIPKGLKGSSRFREKCSSSVLREAADAERPEGTGFILAGSAT